MRNEAIEADHLRTIAALTESDLRATGLHRSPYYSGPAECFDEFEARALLIELAGYFFAPRPPMVADLYFIASADGPIKIGVASEPHKRLKQLQTSNPHKLELLAVLPGGALLEGEYHARFAEHRLVGEWFERHPDILAEADRIGAIPVLSGIKTGPKVASDFGKPA